MTPTANEPKRVTGAARCAKLIRTELKATFPTITFRVRSRNFSGGDSVDVSWDLGPTTRQVEKITKKYQDGWFDGMTDMYEYKKTQDTPESAKYVQCQRSFPEPVYTTMCEDYARLLGIQYHGWNTRSDTHGEYITSLVNRLCSVFDLTANGYQGIEQVAEGTETHGCLEDFYVMIGGTRQARY